MLPAPTVTSKSEAAPALPDRINAATAPLPVLIGGGTGAWNPMSLSPYSFLKLFLADLMNLPKSRSFFLFSAYDIW